MNILDICTKDTADCVIVHPVTGEETDIVITVYGMDSRKFRTISKEIARRRAKDREEGKEVNEIQEDSEMLAELTVGWKNVEMGDGKEMEFSRENAVKLYFLCAPIRDQVNRFIARVGNFLAKA